MRVERVGKTAVFLVPYITTGRNIPIKNQEVVSSLHTFLISNFGGYTYQQKNISFQSGTSTSYDVAMEFRVAVPDFSGQLKLLHDYLAAICMKLDLINMRFEYGKEAFYIYPDDDKQPLTG